MSFVLYRDIDRNHHETTNILIEEILIAVKTRVEHTKMEIRILRIISGGRYKNRSNTPISNSTDYWKILLFIPHLNLLLKYLADKCLEDNLLAFSLLIMHPCNMLNLTMTKFNGKLIDFS